MAEAIRFVTTDEERAAVYRLRYQLYVQDQGFYQDVADHEQGLLYDEDDTCSRLIMAEIDGACVGTLRITWGGETSFSHDQHTKLNLAYFAGMVSEDKILVVSRFMVRPEYRGGTLGLKILIKAFEFVAQQSIDLIVGSCRLHLVNHYYQLGFRPFGPIVNWTNGALVPIAVVSTDFSYLKQIESPMLAVLKQRTATAENLDPILNRLHLAPAVQSEISQDTEAYWAHIKGLLSGRDHALGALLKDRESRSIILARSHIVRHQPGDDLTKKDWGSRTMFLLLSGSLLIKEIGQLVAHVHRPGSVVGEVAFLSEEQCTADVQVGEEGAVVLALCNRNLRQLLMDFREIGARFLHFVTSGFSHRSLDYPIQTDGVKDSQPFAA